MTTHRRLLQALSIAVILSMLLSGFSLPAASAQGPDGLERQRNPQTGKISFLSPENGAVLSAAKALGIAASSRPADPAMALAKRFGPEFGLENPERNLREMKINPAENGRGSVRYQQTYQDVPVMGGELIINTNRNGDLYSMNGEVSTDLSLSTQPTIDAEEAKQTALQAAAKWYEKPVEDFTATEPELWIFDESLLGSSTRAAELVWRMEVTPKHNSLPVRELVLVNAERGHISLHFNQVDTAWGEIETEKILPASDGSAQNAETSADRITPNSTANSAALQTGTTWYVSTTGSDSNSCSTPDLPCATIHAAIGKATTGGTIKIAVGTYTSTGTEVVLINKSVILSSGWNTSFTAQSGYSTVDGQGTRRGITLNSGITVTIERVSVQNGYYSAGPGIYNTGSTLILNNSTIKGNSGPTGWVRSGIYNRPGSTVTLNNSIVSGNSGSGIYNDGSSITVTLNNSTISNNTSTGIRSGSGLVLNNSTLTGNMGGGLYSVGTTTLNNSTISGNTATSGGGIYRYGGTVTLKNTIVAGNSAINNGPDCYGTISSVGYNLIGNSSGCTFTSTTGDLTNLDPRLGELIGSPGYYSLQADSPAIDAGNPATPGSGGNACQANDERGVIRPAGARCDIGAYEYSAPGSIASLSIVSGDGQHTLPGVAFTKTLKVGALDSQGSPVPGVNVTFTAPVSGASGTFADTHSRTTSVMTDTKGIATTSTFTANGLVGSYDVIASANGVGSVNFLLYNVFWYVATTGNDTNDCLSPVTACATINAVLGKADFKDGDTVLVADGSYTGSDSQVVLLNRDVLVSGGWDPTFTTQNGWSTLDGQNARTVVVVGDVTSATVERFVVQNGSGYYGGGIENDGALVLNNSVIRNNTCWFDICGGGIENSETLTLNNSTVVGNISAGSGGGIHNGTFGTLIVNNSTISGNTARGGGGLYSSKTVTLNNTTITGNTATTGSGGGIGFNNGYGGTFTMQNTLVAGNSAGADGPECSGPISSAGYNLIGNNNGCTFSATTGDLVGTSSSPINPRLAPLQDYGGLTFTHALMAGSPAINTGNPATPGIGGSACLVTDQRGTARPNGNNCDIGAFEYTGVGTTPTFLFVYSGMPQSLFKGATSSTPLKTWVLDETGNSMQGVTVTFTAPSTGAGSTFVNTNTNTATAVTDSYGVATAPAFKANNTAGSYMIAARVNGISASANFQITNFVTPVKTYTANNSTSLPGTFLCDQTNPSCPNGDMHSQMATTYATGTAAFYSDKHNRNGADNNSMPIISSVHYSTNYANASWNGSQIVYGDKYGYPLADDVVAHEFTHGVTQHESNLFYYYQSGAINESFSDLWGEYYDQTNGLGMDTANSKWQIGEDVSGLGASRSMSNPPSFSDPDRMTSGYYYRGEEDDGGVHTNSGVNNKAVYLMVDGGSFNNKYVTALGWEKTAAIYYEANTNLLTSGADYSDLYFALQQACSNLIGQKGITSGDCIEVKDAIEAVEMNYHFGGWDNEAPYCDSGDSDPIMIFSDGFESGTGNWTFTNGAYPRWQLDSPYGVFARSGNHSLYADDYPGVITDANARLKSLVVPSHAYLRFAHAYDFETDSSGSLPEYYDGGVLEYSINGGSTWSDAMNLIDYNGYDGVISTGTGNPLSNRIAFVGTSRGYISARVNLASLAGKSVTFRWRMGLDEAFAAWGWWVDDVSVYQCMPGPVGPGVYDDADASIWTYNGSWGTWSGAGPYANTIHYSNATGATATFPFQAPAKFILNYTEDANRGNMLISVDGGAPVSINAYSPSGVHWQRTYTSAIYADMGSHTITISTPGNGKYIDIDAIQIVTPLDMVPPAAITDLAATTGTTMGSVNLSWTAVGDDGMTGTANAYEVRYSTSAISSEAVWLSATKVTSGLPTPKAAGQAESMMVSGLTPGPTYYFAVRARDEEPSLGGLSNSASAKAQTPPPAGPGMYDDGNIGWIYTGSWSTWSGTGPYANTMHYANATGDSASFTFQAPAKFILKYSTNSNRGDLLISVDGGTPVAINSYSAAVKWQQTYTSAMYSDTGSHTVAVSTPGNGKYIDIDAIQIVAPPTPQGPGTYDDAHAAWTYNGTWSTWSGSGPYANTMHYTNTNGASASFTFQAPAKFILTYSANSNRGDILVAVDSGAPVAINSYSAVVKWQETYTSAIYSDSGSHTVTIFTPGNSKYVDIDAIRIVTPLDLVAPAAITDLAATSGTSTGSVNLSWTAAGDDGATGTASSYAVRYSTSAINNEAVWANATPVTTSLPAPKAAGQTENMTISGLVPGQTYYFAIRAQDEEPNLGGVSNSPSAIAKTPPPAGAGTYDDAHVNWTYSGSWSTWSGTGPYANTIHYSNAPGAVASFTFQAPAKFVLMYSTNSNRGDILVSVDGGVPVAINSYGAAVKWQQSYTSAMYADTSTHTVTISTPGNGKYIDIDAIQIVAPPSPQGSGSYDDAHSAWTYNGNWSTWSGSGPYANTMHYTNATGASATFTFQAPAKFTLSFQAASNRGNILVSVDGGTPVLVDAYSATSQWQKSYTSAMYPDTDAHTVTISTPGNGKYIDVDAIRIAAPSDLVAPAAITSLGAMNGPTVGSVYLSWNSVGDDGMSGTASSYEVRYSTTSIGTEADWANAIEVTTGIPAPSPAGQAEQMTISGLVPGENYYFVVRAKDEESNLGGLSNSPLATATEPAPAEAGTYDDSHANWMYSGDWSTWSGTGPSSSTMHYTNTTGATANFIFRGPAKFILTYSTNSNRGDILISVDGGEPVRINAYSSTVKWQQSYTSILYSDTSIHTVTISTPGNGKYIDVDAIQIVAPPTPQGSGTYDDTHSAWMYNGSWGTWNGAGPSGNTIHYSNTTGATATFTFRAPARFILTYSANSNRGDIMISVDDGAPVPINSYNSSVLWLQTYTSEVFSDTGAHTITISTPGNGKYIDVDAITIE